MQLTGATPDLTVRCRPITALLEQLASGQLSSLRCTEAFMRRAILAQQLTNCLTEVMFDTAMDRAQECDRFLREKGKPIGLLHCLPVSLKDQVRALLRHLSQSCSTALLVSSM